MFHERDLSTWLKAFFFVSLHVSELAIALRYSVPQVKSRKHGFKMYQHLWNITHFFTLKRKQRKKKKRSKTEMLNGFPQYSLMLREESAK